MLATKGSASRVMHMLRCVLYVVLLCENKATVCEYHICLNICRDSISF